jgi:hypothetical protein
VKLRITAIVLSTLPALASLAAMGVLNQRRIDTINRGQDATSAIGATVNMGIIGLGSAAMAAVVAGMLLPAILEHRRTTKVTPPHPARRTTSMTATLFQDPLALALAPALKAPASIPGAVTPSFIAPAATDPQGIPDIRRAQRDHAEHAKADLAAELAAAMAGTEPLRTR